MSTSDYRTDFLAFRRDLAPVEGDWGPAPVIPPFLANWYAAAFPPPEGNPAARNILDGRTKKQGKSADAAAAALYLATRKSYSQVVIASSDLDQSRDRVLRACKFAVEHGPLGAHVRVFRTVMEFDNSSTIEAIASDWRGAAGGDYAGVVFDELHAFLYESQRRLFDELTIPPTRPTGCRWMASYPGFIGESLLLEEWWKRALQGERLPGELPVYRHRAASLLALIDTGPESWRMPWMTPEYIAEVREAERPNTFRRLWLGEWVSSESRFLPEGAWEACYSDQVRPLAPKDGRKVILGADASTSRDLTALVGVVPDPKTGLVDVVFVRVWKPTRGELRGGKPTVDLAGTIGAEVARLLGEGSIRAICYDPYQLATLAAEWERAGIHCVELAQNAGRVESDTHLFDSIIGKSVRHYGHPALSEHIRNAVSVETPRGIRLAKEKTSLKIDLAVALSMAVWAARDASPAPQHMPDPDGLKQRSRWDLTPATALSVDRGGNMLFDETRGQSWTAHDFSNRGGGSRR